jgi:hypothetical protein
VRRCFGGFAQGIAAASPSRHDHGSQYMSDVFQRELRFLGHRELARLRPRARGQRLRRTLHPHAQGKPAVGADLRHGRRTARALLEFRDAYNATWLIERHGFRTPDAVRQEQLQPAALGRVGFNTVSPSIPRAVTGAAPSVGMEGSSSSNSALFWKDEHE